MLACNSTSMLRRVWPQWLQKVGNRKKYTFCDKTCGRTGLPPSKKKTTNQNKYCTPAEVCMDLEWFGIIPNKGLIFPNQQSHKFSFFWLTTKKTSSSTPPQKKTQKSNQTNKKHPPFFEILPPFSRQNPRTSAPSFVALLKGTKISSRKPAPNTCSTWRRSACKAFDVKVNQGVSDSCSDGSEPAVGGWLEVRPLTQKIHVGCIYLHLGVFNGKCR